MMRIGTSAAAAALLATACAPSGAEPEEHPLAVAPAFLELGRVPFGDRREGLWTLENRSARTLEIVRAGPLGCQCAQAALALPDGRVIDVADGLPISARLAPGARAELRFVLDTARYRDPISRKVGAVPLIFADAPPLVLEWAVDVWTPFAVEPWDVDLGAVGVRQRAQGRVLVQGHDDDDFGLEVEAVEDGWSVRSRRLSGAGEKALYELLVTAPPELPEGGFQRAFRFLTDLPGAPPVRFTVRGVAGPDLALTPARVFLDPANGRGEARVALVQRARDGLVLRLEVEGLPPGLQLAEADAEPAARREFLLRWSGAPPAETLRGALTVITGDAERPRIKLPYTVMPRAAEQP
jgi:hypothetical protein